MMRYFYRALNGDGNEVTGTVEAPGSRAAIRKLKGRGLTVVEISGKAPGQSYIWMKPPGSREIKLIFQEMCILLESGVTLKEAVQSLAESCGNPYLSRELVSVSDAVRRGISFSEALNGSRLRLPSYFQPLIETGELTGRLARSMRDGISQWEYDVQSASEFRNALIYPCILVFSGIVAVTLIFTLVVPRFEKMLSRTEDIPLLSKAVLGVGVFFRNNIEWIGVLAVGLIFLLSIAYWQHKDLLKGLKRLLYQIPLFRKWIFENEIASWSSTMAVLLVNRVPLLSSLEMAQRRVTLSPLHARLSHVARSVKNGGSLSESLREMDAISATGYNLMRVGERSGELAEMFRVLASLYKESGRNRTRVFLIILEPVSILVIGVFVGLIMAGVVLAITSTYEVLR